LWLFFFFWDDFHFLTLTPHTTHLSPSSLSPAEMIDMMDKLGLSPEVALEPSDALARAILVANKQFASNPPFLRRPSG
jgi:hypothetical protein